MLVCCFKKTNFHSDDLKMCLIIVFYFKKDIVKMQASSNTSTTMFFIVQLTRCFLIQTIRKKIRKAIYILRASFIK